MHVKDGKQSKKMAGKETGTCGHSNLSAQSWALSLQPEMLPSAQLHHIINCSQTNSEFTDCSHTLVSQFHKIDFLTKFLAGCTQSLIFL